MSRQNKLNKKPSLKQIKAAHLVAENILGKNNLTKKQILLKVGYKPTIAVNPQYVTESKGFKDVLEKLLPDMRLAEKHQELLENEKAEIQVKALDMAYKVKGSYAAEKREISSPFSLAALFTANESEGSDDLSEDAEVPHFLRGEDVDLDSSADQA